MNEAVTQYLMMPLNHLQYNMIQIHNAKIWYSMLSLIVIRIKKTAKQNDSDSNSTNMNVNPGFGVQCEMLDYEFSGLIVNLFKVSSLNTHNTR